MRASLEHRFGLEDAIGGRGPLAVAHPLGEVLGAAACLDEAPDVPGPVGVGVVAAGEPLGAVAGDDVLDALVAHADRPDRADDRQADRVVALRRLPAVWARQECLDGGDDRSHRVVVEFGRGHSEGGSGVSCSVA